MKTIDKIITKLDCRAGAPMGRANVQEGKFKMYPIIQLADYNGLPKIYDCKVPLIQGYDKGGAYWGSPDNLRVRYTKDLNLIYFYRK